jgi:phage terminase small subunit
MSRRRLSDRQRRFCLEYLIDPNATQAAVKAGYSPMNAKQQGYENLTKPYVVAEIRRLQLKRNEKLELDAEWATSRLARFGDGNIGDFMTFTKSGEMVLNLENVPKEKMALLSEVTQDRLVNGKQPVLRTKIKLYSALDALKALLQHLKPLEPPTDHREDDKPVLDPSKLTDDELRTLIALHEKAKVTPVETDFTAEGEG